VVQCHAKHNNKSSAAEVSGRLEPMILLADGTHVMITHNLWTSKGISKFYLGLVNGS
jgi:hypothetical protein